MAFILYSPFGSQWAAHDHKEMMIVTMMFAWHNAAAFVFLILMGTYVYHRVKRLDSSNDFYQSLKPRRNCSDNEEESILQSEDEEIV